MVPVMLELSQAACLCAVMVHVCLVASSRGISHVVSRLDNRNNYNKTGSLMIPYSVTSMRTNAYKAISLSDRIQDYNM
jgi:hypothetical protein